MTNYDKYQEYFDLYNNYTKTHNLGNKYLEQGEVVKQTKYYRLMCYKMDSRLRRNDIKEDDTKTLIIPSIFNSPEIFFLARNKSFIENLRTAGDIYLIDWLEVKEPAYSLNDYVDRIIEVMSNFNNINLIGHCIGGNLAIAANVMIPQKVKTLTLLTCPWDFLHFFYVKALHQYLKLDGYIENLPLVPKIHIQILFFLLFPDYFNVKLDRFFSLTSEKEQDLAFRIENWLMSGHDLPKATYHQIMQNILSENMFESLEWKINDIIIDPSLIDCPVYIVAASDDKIVPQSSILPLQKLLKNSTLIEVEGGHISYLINNKLDGFFFTRHCEEITALLCGSKKPSVSPRGLTTGSKT
ncbi:MAG TPA: alpha/beta fold hydrolase [Rickettsia endosymbiont of Pyrocoelia pectoralis]|nr:alpha/beta fold hydrolase [Rickettsia endosymbiont of Pyrocoelia pectoralis]